MSDSGSAPALGRYWCLSIGVVGVARGWELPEKTEMMLDNLPMPKITGV